MSTKRLWKCDVSVTVYVYAEDEREAMEVAQDGAAADLGEFCSCDCEVEEVVNPNHDLSNDGGWEKNSIPHSYDPEESVTIGEHLKSLKTLKVVP